MPLVTRCLEMQKTCEESSNKGQNEINSPWGLKQVVIVKQMTVAQVQGVVRSSG